MEGHRRFNRKATLQALLALAIVAGTGIRAQVVVDWGKANRAPQQSDAEKAKQLEQEKQPRQPLIVTPPPKPEEVPLRGWAPPDIDKFIPPTDRSVPCPLEDVVRSASARVEELVINLQQFSATEIIAASEVDKDGNAHGTRSGSFEYFAYIERVRGPALSVQEYRDGSTAFDAFPSKVASLGTVASALIFHPLYRDDFTMECEGLTLLREKPAWQIHFLQRPDRANNFRSYYSNGVRYPAKIKGRAWIAADSYQVLRLENELAEPVKDLVQRELRIIEYTPVPFPKRNLELWLPQTAELYLEYRKHRFHNRQTFSEFQLFWVETEQTDKLPKGEAE